MIIEVINAGCILSLEAKNNPPVRPNGDAPESGEIAFEGVQPVARQIQVFGAGRLIKQSRDAPDFFDMLLKETPPVVFFIQAAQAAMPKPGNHAQEVMRQLTSVKRHLTIFR